MTCHHADRVWEEQAVAQEQRQVHQDTAAYTASAPLPPPTSARSGRWIWAKVSLLRRVEGRGARNYGGGPDPLITRLAGEGGVQASGMGGTRSGLGLIAASVVEEVA